MSMPWFGELPERWETQKVSELFAERREKVSDIDFAPPSVSKGGIVPQISTAKATARVLKLSKDERARLPHEYEVRAWRDEMARLDDAREEGIAKGIAKGLEEGIAKGSEEGKKAKSLAIARNLLELELPMETISKAKPA